MEHGKRCAYGKKATIETENTMYDLILQRIQLHNKDTKI